MKKKILVVEDDPMILKMIGMILDEYEVLIASDGQTGVNKALEENPDLILMDLTLPVLDGYEAINMLQSFPGAKDIPVIALTAKKLPFSELKEHGFSDYQQKPFSPDVLVEKIGKYFSSEIL